MVLRMYSDIHPQRVRTKITKTPPKATVPYRRDDMKCAGLPGNICLRTSPNNSTSCRGAPDPPISSVPRRDRKLCRRVGTVVALAFGGMDLRLAVRHPPVRHGMRGEPMFQPVR